MNLTPRLAFRPHNFMCTLGFQGMGYSPAFVANLARIVDSLHPDSRIEVVATSDSICQACPNKRGLHCKDEAKIRGLDERHAAILGLIPGTSITWGEAKNRMRKHMSLARFHKACAGCSWKPLGVCEAALKALHADAP